MNKRNLCVVAVVGVSLAGGISVARADSSDRAIAARDQFQLDSGEKLAVQRATATKGYRVCMDDTKRAVPLKVEFDGKEAIVAPGEGQLIEATAIRLSSAGKLRDGMTLIGKFNGTWTEDAADTRVAQVAQN